MRRLIFVLALLSASALVECQSTTEDPSPPEYKETLELYDQAVEKVKDLAPSKEDNGTLPAYNKKRHYGLLVAVLHDLAKVLSSSCGPSYEDYYLLAVRKGVSVGWDKPKSVAKHLDKALKKAEAKIGELRDLINEKCQNSSLPSNSSCNEEVASAVEKDPQRYGDASQALFKLGELSSTYLNNTFEKEAEEYDTVKFLVTGQEKLKDLATKLVEATKEVMNDIDDYIKCLYKDSNKDLEKY